LLGPFSMLVAPGCRCCWWWWRGDLPVKVGWWWWLAVCGHVERAKFKLWCVSV